MVNRDLTHMRETYHSDGLDRSGISDDPFVQFDKWFREYLELDEEDANAMTLSTCGAGGRPTSRTVLLKSFDNNGFVFFTNYSSKKGKAIADNPFASLLFFWRKMHRQIRIEGKVEKISESESEEYFHTRPRESQIAALVSHQSAIIKDRDELLEKYNEADLKYKGNEIPIPKDWGGYRLIPDLFEFWQGRENRLHDRIQYSLKNNLWEIDRLSP